MANFTLHTETVQSWLPISRLHILCHFVAIVLLFYYRINQLFQESNTPILAWALVTIAELTFAVLWFFGQAFRWRPVARSVKMEKLPGDDNLPGLDIFICTIDPEKEPTVEVMDTVISAIAMDYPAKKLAVYLSDDGACPVTFYAVKEASDFAKVWVPFCKKYGIKSRCPKAFFSPMEEEREQLLRTDEFRAEQQEIKAKYEKMQKNIEKFGTDPKSRRIVTDRSPRIEIINDETDMPLLVYVSRERRPSLPHKFKGGALNTLLRVSGVMSNGPYVLVVDCDMYCNDPSSAKQAMCFFLDPETSKDHAFVQFPQMFHNLSKKDIYDSQSRNAFKTMWQGMDGLRGPGLSGSGNYLSRSALLFGSPNQKEDYLLDPQNNFGKSTMYIESLKVIGGQNNATKKNIPRDAILQEAQVVASCTYETNTNWGKEVGFSYGILLESTITGYLLHCRGWKSAYLYPKRPCFLGCAPTDIKEGMMQLVKWCSELCLLAVSKYSPFSYGISSKMSTMHCFTYCFLAITSLYAVAFIIYGIVPQVCFLKGIPVFPKVSDPWFAVFAVLYLSTQIQHLIEVLSGDGSVAMWWDEQRIWILKSVTGSLFSLIEATKKWMGLKKAKFNLSDKAIDKEKLKKYEEGRFNFQGAAVFMSPLVVLLIVNVVCFFGGLWRLLKVKDFEDMFGQLFLLSYLMVLSYPIFEGMVTFKSKGG